MIRRDVRSTNGEPAWVLIDQVEHARIAGDLAKFWGADGFAELEPRKIVLPTIYRHDDGWLDYDPAPEVDVELGRPYSFTEMPIDTAHAIWSRSIDEMADLGPLSQYLVASHFIVRRRDGARSATPEAVRFLQTYRTRCHQWLDRWQRDDPANTEPQTLAALEHLQLFDALSLWFCCAELDASTRFACPGDRSVTFRPLGEGQVAVEPWPFVIDRFEIEATGRQVPAKFYGDTRALLAETSVPVKLNWRLVSR